MTDKSLHSFSVFVSFAVKHFTRSDGINEQHGKNVYEWTPVLTRSLGRPKNRWEDDVKSDITKMKITNWKDCIGNRPKWKEFVEKAKTCLES